MLPGDHLVRVLDELIHQCRQRRWLSNLIGAIEERVNCQVPEKLNIKVRTKKGQLADHDLWHSDRATVDLTLRVASLDYKN